MGDSSTKNLDPWVNQVNFMFAFNDIDFSDRVLHIEIMDAPHDPADSKPDHEECDSVPQRKRMRKNLEEETRDETVAHSIVAEGSAVAKVKTLRINAAILASKSPFFYKLFKNGMKESQQRGVITLKINASEEAALMELLNFMYSNTLSATTILELLGVLVIADKFEVISCMKYCCNLLQNLPMSLDSAILFLDLPSSILVDEAIHPLIDATKQYLADRYKDIDKSKKELMTLPLPAVEAVLGSDCLRLRSEDVLFGFILEWARTHYPKLEERRDILTQRLVGFIRFPYMTCQNLKMVLNCPDFHHKEVCKLVFDAISCKIEGTPVSDSRNQSDNCSFIRRVYSLLPVNIVQLELSRPRCIVYFKLKKDECADLLFRSRSLYTDKFCVGGWWFSLVPHCYKHEETSLYHFGLLLYVITTTNGSSTCTIDFEFEVMMKPSEKFELIKFKLDNYTVVVKSLSCVTRNLFDTTWADFMADDSEYFINDILHIRASLTIKNS